MTLPWFNYEAMNKININPKMGITSTITPDFQPIDEVMKEGGDNTFNSDITVGTVEVVKMDDLSKSI
ncbi:hypothetical protein PB01_07820 [Psychrobacillus glaciei]|uniref:Uncharacterized protein n=1 Tax=Psychrobacillus glaciei TaxID=2283160 RepID=A0A5J6SLI0_9BACI|nr:hypothetical protein [Psychrobacillus glaciei]QFF98746.1 hypothetical protein PB01_07820 [Psychrobacillus glaciei]